jgi:bacillithiol system protein YtxJ
MMDWQKLTDIKQLATIDEESKVIKVLIFKHSTRCGISAASLARIERTWKNEYGAGLKPYYLDLLSYRNISEAISKHYGIAHQSPQALIISNGKCFFEQTHNGIRLEEILGVND